MGWLKDLRTEKPVLGEIVKQAIDQPLHVLMTVGSVWGISGAFWGIWFVAGDGIVLPLQFLFSVIAGGSLTALWVALREKAQWPSSRWWDPPLDWLFSTIGIGLGIWSFRPVVDKIIALLG